MNPINFPEYSEQIWNLLACLRTQSEYISRIQCSDQNLESVFYEKSIYESCYLLQQFLSIIEIIEEGITVSDEGGKFIIFNQKMIEITGYTGEDANQNQDFLAKIYPCPVEYEKATLGIEKVKKTGKSQNQETTICDKQGVCRTLLVSTSLIEINGKNWLVSAYRDISDRKQIELALRQQNQQERLLLKTLERIRKSLDLEEILQTTVAEVQQFLGADRVLIYQLQNQHTGCVIAEAVTPDYPHAMTQDLPAEMFPTWCCELYCKGRIRTVTDIETDIMAPCLAETLKKLEVKSKIVVPILHQENLWGLLIAHQCNRPRKWQQWEIELLSILATQVAIAIQQSQLYHQLVQANGELLHLATTDALTQVANRRWFDEYLHQEWYRLAREQAPLALILADIDYFKAYNDDYGHVRGDYCLQAIATALSHSVRRSTDLVARYGGEEFAVILPNTPLSGAEEVAQEIHRQVQHLQIQHPTSAIADCVTLSIGIACTIPTPDQSPLQLLDLTDRALYQAKQSGRNCTIVYSLPTSQSA